MYKALKIITLLILWIVFSPIFILMAKRWNMLKLKTSIPLALISPFGLIVLACLFLAGYSWYLDFYRTHHFVDKDVIQNITSIQLPNFEVIDYQKGKSSFSGEYSDNIDILFETDIAASTFSCLDSIIITTYTQPCGEMV